MTCPPYRKPAKSIDGSGNERFLRNQEKRRREIGAMLKQMRIAGKISLESEAQNEERRILDDEIEFRKQNNN